MVNQAQLIKVRIKKEAAGEQLCLNVEKGVNLDLQALDGLLRLRQSVERQMPQTCSSTSASSTWQLQLHAVRTSTGCHLFGIF